MSDTNSTPEPATAAHVYRPRGGAKRLFETRDPEVLVCGPSGTGKSRGCLEKVNALAELHPGIRVLMTRKTRRSLSESVLAEYERSVVPPGSPLLLAGGERAHRSKYQYANGSEIILAGLDDIHRIMSAQFDIVYCPETTELTEGEWEILLSRLRNNALRDRQTGEPWHQAIADCNPSFPQHWLKLRCDRGQMTYIESRHADNPVASADYLERLSELSGVRRQRLYLGQWVSAEGSVYSEWDRNVHIVEPFTVPGNWLRVRAIDFGFRDPFVCLWLAVDPERRLYCYRQLYMTGRLVEDHARDIIQLSRAESVRATICDTDAEGRGTLERRGIRTVPASKSVMTGIQAVQARLRRSGDGRPRLFVLRDCLVERDPALTAAKRPTCLEEEMESYSWDVPAEGQLLRERPIDRDNHALDALRYAVMALARAQRIAELPRGSVVMVRPKLLDIEERSRIREAPERLRALAKEVGVFRPGFPAER